jgi:hypothetical protein
MSWKLQYPVGSSTYAKHVHSFPLFEIRETRQYGKAPRQDQLVSMTGSASYICTSFGPNEMTTFRVPRCSSTRPITAGLPEAFWNNLIR